METPVNSDAQCSTGACPISPGPAVDTLPAFRAAFPVFAGHPDRLYFDNAATTQKPASVIQVMNDFYSHSCSNAGRAAYRLATRAEADVERVRKRVASLLNASAGDVVFTSGATESLNTVALSWGLANLKTGDEVMVCLEDHKSTVLPWLNLKSLLQRFGVQIKIVPFGIHLEGDYELKSIREKFTPATRLLAMTHVHHLYGLDMEVQQVRQILGEGVLISLDASQSVGHRKVDVAELGVDFVCFSGHKMFAANGIGLLWVAPRVQGQLASIKLGGKTPGTIGDGVLQQADKSLPALLESGTLNIPGILSLEPAIDLIEKTGIDSIEKRVSTLTHYLYDQVKLLPGIEFSAGFGRCGCPIGYGIIAFRFEQHRTTDLAFLLDGENIMVRTGDHCLANPEQGDEFIRVSLHAYNTEAEVDRFVEVLKANLT